MPRVKLDSDRNHRIIEIVKKTHGFDVSLQSIKAIRKANMIAEIEELFLCGYTYESNRHGLVVVKRKPRMTRNPKTGEKIQLPERYTIKITLSKKLKAKFQDYVKRNGVPFYKRNV